MIRTAAVLVPVFLFLGLGMSAPTAAFSPHRSSVSEEAPHKFPMTASDFRKVIASEVERAREHMERFVVNKELTKDQADAMRARFDVALAKVDKRTAEVCADAIVTKEEADSVHLLVQGLLREIRTDD
jgi:hypothetical protein